MSKEEIRTLVKAAYVIIAAEGQTFETLSMLQDVSLKHIPQITQTLVMEGEDMSMELMVNNLMQFGVSTDTAMQFLNDIGMHVKNFMAITLLNEIKDILRLKQYSKYKMPQLAARIKTEKLLFG